MDRLEQYRNEYTKRRLTELDSLKTCGFVTQLEYSRIKNRINNQHKYISSLFKAVSKS